MKFSVNPLEKGKTPAQKVMSRIQEGKQEVLVGRDIVQKDGRCIILGVDSPAEDCESLLESLNLAQEIRNQGHEANQNKDEDLDIAA